LNKNCVLCRISAQEGLYWGMPQTKKPLTRYNILDRCFSNSGRNYTFEDLREEINDKLREGDPAFKGISTRQLRDDIAFMRSSEGWSAPIETFPGIGKKRYYRYDEQNFSINNASVNATQIEELNIALQVLSEFQGLPQFQFMEDMIFRMKDELDMATNVQQEKVIDWGGNLDLIGRENLSPLYDAVSRKKRVNFTYTPFGGESFRVVGANPVFLKQYNDRWFMFTFEEGREYVNNRALDRISNIQVTDTEIDSQIEFDPEEYFWDIVGVTRNEGEPKRIKVYLHPRSYPYIVTKPIHHSQRNNDEEYSITVKLIPNREFESQLKQYDLIGDWKEI